MFCCTAPSGKLAFLVLPFGRSGCWAQCILFPFNYFLVLCVMVPNRATASNIREESSACSICVSGNREALAVTSHSCCDTLPAVWCCCGAHASHNHGCRENAHFQTNQPLKAIVLPVQRATKYQENSLYIIPAVKSNLQCSGTKAKVQAMHRLFPYGEGFRAWEKNSLWSIVALRKLL